MIAVKIELLTPDAVMPRYMTEYAAGMDLHANPVEVCEKWYIPEGHTLTLGTGIAIALPAGYEAQIRSRSGMAASYGVHVLNSPGTIDADYRGEIRVILRNSGLTPYTVRRGDRIAQIVFAPITKAIFSEGIVLSDTARGLGGLGSTGR